jgi:hypothetical protein
MGHGTWHVDWLTRTSAFRAYEEMQTYVSHSSTRSKFVFIFDFGRHPCRLSAVSACYVRDRGAFPGHGSFFKLREGSRRFGPTNASLGLSFFSLKGMNDIKRTYRRIRQQTSNQPPFKELRLVLHNLLVHCNTLPRCYLYHLFSNSS